MLTALHLCDAHRWRVRRYRILRFQPGLNLLIGPNGTGKSTILRAIAGCPDCRRTEDGETDYDDRYDDAVALVTQTRQASISMVQRHLRIGYNRAARLL